LPRHSPLLAIGAPFLTPLRAIIAAVLRLLHARGLSGLRVWGGLSLSI
jgi:hypothetical protein